MESKSAWISVNDRLPNSVFNVIVWIPNDTPRGGYVDLASYGEWLCENEDCVPGGPNYVADNDEGNFRGFGWHREEETHGGPYDYVTIDLNTRVTHWMPLPEAPNMSTQSTNPPDVSKKDAEIDRSFEAISDEEANAYIDSMEEFFGRSHEFVAPIQAAGYALVKITDLQRRLKVAEDVLASKDRCYEALRVVTVEKDALLRELRDAAASVTSYWLEGGYIPGQENRLIAAVIKANTVLS